MSDLRDLAVELAGRASHGEEIEAYATHSREFTVKAYMGEVEHLSAAEPRGLGVRVVSSNKAGFAYTTDLSDHGRAEVLERARENASFATPDEAVGVALPSPFEPLPDLADASLRSVTPDRKVRFATELETLTRSSDPRVRTVEEAGYSDSISETAIATSTGIDAWYERTDAWCYSIAIAAEGDDTEVGFEFDLARGIEGLDAEAVARSAADRACRVLGAKKIPSGRMPVVFDPYVAGQFLGVMGSVLTGESAQKKRSLFAGRVGQPVASEQVTLIDDGRAAGAPGASPFDDEGVPTRRTVVIQDGVLKTFLYDSASARREGIASTGNARRGGFKSPPGPRPSNIALEPTDEVQDLLRRAGRALLVQTFHGVHSGANPISGQFSVGATGALLEDGFPAQPVKEVTIAAPMLEILGAIAGVGGDRRWLPSGGSYGGATTLISEMTVAGL